ncbi:MAG TPA: hypothetical protein VMW41_06265 [Candidatus Bathyarchaeia archaeon]|nr:hypothetical protein [Candidatus Bathyarchaeia archaeon]
MRKVIATEIGTLGIWDSLSLSFINSEEKYKKNFVTGKDIANLMNKGFGVFWNTGGDGHFVIDIRVNPEHDLLPAEEEMIEMETRNHKLVVTGGSLTVGSPETAGSMEEKALAEGYIAKLENIAPGTYKVDVYFVYDNEAVEGNKPAEEDLTANIVILKKVPEDTNFEELWDIPSLG